MLGAKGTTTGPWAVLKIPLPLWGAKVVEELDMSKIVFAANVFIVEKRHLYIASSLKRNLVIVLLQITIVLGSRDRGASRGL